MNRANRTRLLKKETPFKKNAFKTWLAFMSVGTIFLSRAFQIFALFLLKRDLPVGYPEIHDLSRAQRCS